MKLLIENHLVRLSRVEDSPFVLGASKAFAERRFLSLEGRLQRDPITKEEFHRLMAKYLEVAYKPERFSLDFRIANGGLRNYGRSVFGHENSAVACPG